MRHTSLRALLQAVSSATCPCNTDAAPMLQTHATNGADVAANKTSFHDSLPGIEADSTGNGLDAPFVDNTPDATSSATRIADAFHDHWQRMECLPSPTDEQRGILQEHLRAMDAAILSDDYDAAVAAMRTIEEVLHAN